jgi:hypothetical protein
MILVGDEVVTRRTILGMILQAHGDGWGIVRDPLVRCTSTEILNQVDHRADLRLKVLKAGMIKHVVE